MTKYLTPAVRIQKARTALLLDHPFFWFATLPSGWAGLGFDSDHGHGWHFLVLQSGFC
jgi:hypothetical protein